MQPPAERPVVVGFDGSPSSTSALDLAAAEAVLRENALRIVYVREPPDRWHTVGRRTPALIDPDLVVAEARQRVVDRHPRLAVESHILDGLPSVVLIEQSGAASVTVVGHQGGGGFLGLAAGSVCVQLSTRGHGVIMVARGASALSGEAPVVVGVDAGAPASEAIDFGFAEAAARRVPLHAVYAWQYERAGGTFAPAGYDFAQAQEQAARRLAEAMAGWSEQYPDVKVERHTDHSLDPPAALLAASIRAGLAVVGPHDQTGPRRLMLGSVADTLIHHARCPVAVVHS